jgi:murein L,D-transpeptidase YcbB/YkuD
LQRAYAAAGAPIAAPAAAGRRRPVSDNSPFQRKELAVALERQRWLPRHLPATRIWVNTEDAHLDFYRDDRKVFSTRVVVGERDKQTPEFETHTPSVLFNPPWYVPRSIAAKEILPKLASNPGYLAQHHMSWHSGTIRQDAGPYSALGRLKFEMPDPFDVYLHDTPSRGLFAAAERHRSHGCVRVQNPTELAALLLNEDEATIERKVAVGYSHRQGLPRPVPVFIVYQTVTVDPNGSVRFLPDVYSRDEHLWELLNRRPQGAVEQIALAGRSRG